jgi:hypothetical protein
VCIYVELGVSYLSSMRQGGALQSKSIAVSVPADASETKPRLRYMRFSFLSILSWIPPKISPLISDAALCERPQGTVQRTRLSLSNVSRS